MQQVKTDGTDQSHLPTLHFSVPELIGDRTEYLLQNNNSTDKTEEKGFKQEKSSISNPGDAVGRIIHAAHVAASVLGQDGQFQCIVPCNTFHAPSIFEACVKASGGIRPIHMVEETVEYIHRTMPSIKNVGLMCTTGTRSLRLYHNLLEKHGYNVCEVPEDVQAELHQTIYDKQQGIKACGKTNWSTERFQSYANMCVKSGAEVIILGCTEIPIVLQEFTILLQSNCGAHYPFTVPLIDPLVCGARALVQKTYPNKLIGG